MNPRFGIRVCTGACLFLLLLSGCVAVQPLQLVSGPDPLYPPTARSAGVEGYVRVRYDITADGEVANLRVVEAAPPGVFDASALQAVAQWRFRPRMVDGRRIAVPGRVSRLDFRVGQSDAYAGY